MYEMEEIDSVSAVFGEIEIRVKLNHPGLDKVKNLELFYHYKATLRKTNQPFHFWEKDIWVPPINNATDIMEVIISMVAFHTEAAFTKEEQELLERSIPAAQARAVAPIGN